MPSRAKKRYCDPPASGRGQGCPVHALAPPEGVLTPAAAAPAASRQTPAPASTAAGCSQAPGGGERHAPSHARDTARYPYIAGIPRSLDAPSPDPGNGSRRAPIRDLSAPASRSLSRARLPQEVVPWETSKMRMPIHRVRASPHAPVHMGPAARVETQGRLGRPYGLSLMGVSCVSDVSVASGTGLGRSSDGCRRSGITGTGRSVCHADSSRGATPPTTLPPRP